MKKSDEAGVPMKAANKGAKAPAELPGGKGLNSLWQKSVDRALGASHARLDGQMDTGGARPLNHSSPSRVTGPTQRTDFFHGLSTKGNSQDQSTYRTQGRGSVSQAVERIRQAATRKPQEKLTALLHHITTDALRCAFYDLKKTASAGVDGLVWTRYEDGLEERLLDLHGRVHSGAYRALPSRRVEIPKPEERTLGGVPVDWARSQSALGNALFALSEREDGTEHLQQAVAAYQLLVTMFPDDGPRPYRHLVRSNRTRALDRLRERQNHTHQAAAEASATVGEAAAINTVSAHQMRSSPFK